jgi:hypothetical protein
MANEGTTNSAPQPSKAGMPAKSRWWVKYIVLVVVLAVIGCPAFFIYRLSHAFDALNNQQLADSAAILQPPIYKPAGLYLARLMQSQRSLWDRDDTIDPDWLPAELGSVHLHEFTMGASACSLVWGGGGDDDLGRSGFDLERDPTASTTSGNAYVLSYGCAQGSLDGRYPPKTGEYRFTIAKTDHIDEEEFVRRGLAEIAREQAAFASGTEFNVYNYNPDYMRKQLLAQHPAIAARLGYAVPATQPATTSMPTG